VEAQPQGRVQAATAAVTAAAGGPEDEVVRALVALRSALEAAYTRRAGAKIAGSCVLWWACRA
jgi:hypothetical protein